MMWKLWENRASAFGMFRTTTRPKESMIQQRHCFRKVMNVRGKCKRFITRTSVNGRNEH